MQQGCDNKCSSAPICPRLVSHLHLAFISSFTLPLSSQVDRARSPQSQFPSTSTFSPSRSLGVAATLSQTERERLKKFESTRTNSLRPIVFQPNGSFRALKENGKLAVGPEEADVYKGRIKNPLAETAYHLPGCQLYATQSELYSMCIA